MVKLIQSITYTLLYSIICVSLAAQDHVLIGKGQTQGVAIQSSSNAQRAQQTLSGFGFLPNHCNAARFLMQATLGADIHEINMLTEKGIERWIHEQLNLPLVISMQDMVSDYHDYRRVGENDPTANSSMTFWDYTWWQYHMTQPDLLRQRVAFALSEILVISRISSFNNNPYAFANYYDMLLKHSFGNFKDLLTELTYHPAMGMYLTYVNNPKTDSIRNRFPDENYAREVMQLFTIGLFELNNNGTQKLDAMGQAIPTYNNEDISEYSKIFTGLMWGDRDPIQSQFFKQARENTSYTVPLQMFNEMHEPGEKRLLNGFVVPNRNPVDGNADIADAIDNLFNHPNVGPFIAHLLIQRMVTSNPSPDYIDAVASAFNNNGLGERGDMKAVIMAILTRPEARDCDAEQDAGYGMLREPFIRYVQMAKALQLTTNSGKYRNIQNSVYQRVEQKPFLSPSVFNFFQPDHQPIGGISEANLVAPEFQITNSQTIMAYMNGVNDWIVRKKFAEEWSLFDGEVVPDNEKSFFDFSDEKTLVLQGRYIELFDGFNMLLAQGKISQEHIDRMIEVLKTYPTDSDNRLEDAVRVALYMILCSPEYLISK